MRSSNIKQLACEVVQLPLSRTSHSLLRSPVQIVRLGPNYEYLMQQVLHRHGLNQSRRFTKLGYTLCSINPPYLPRRFHGDKKNFDQEADDQHKKKTQAQIIIESSKFLGLPYLDKVQPASNDDAKLHASTGATARPLAKTLEPNPSLSAGISSRESGAVALEGQSAGDMSEARPNQQDERPPPRFMRRIRKPKRFPRLIWERKRLARAGKITDSTTGGPPKVFSRAILDTEVLEGELRWVSRTAPHPKTMGNLLQILIGQRKVKPTPEHYEALILGNCFPELGSVDSVKTILQEMEREDIPFEPLVLFAVLMVLAVHPDSHLRTNIMERLARQQVPIPDLYSGLVILAMIREDQLELATVELEKLTQKGVSIPRWLWTIYIHAICDQHDFDALIQLLYKLSDGGFLFPQPTLLHLLITASEHGDITITKWIWHGYVENMHIIPNEALCLTVLRLAVANLDLKLARSVKVILGSVAGNKTTEPPSLIDTQPSTKSERFRLSFNSADLPGLPSPFIVEGPKYLNPSDSAFVDPPPTPSDDENEENDRLALAMSTPPPLPDTSTPIPFRPLPAEALQLLAELGIDPDDDGVYMVEGKGDGEALGKTSYAGRHITPGILYPVFRAEEGMHGARFDPRLALMQGWDWRKK